MCVSFPRIKAIVILSGLSSVGRGGVVVYVMNV